MCGDKEEERGTWGRAESEDKMPENHQRVFALPASRSRVCVRPVNTRFSPAGIQREIRDALHVRTQVRARERERGIARFGDFADKAVNYSPLRALSSATNAQACAQPTRASNTNS